MTKRLLQFLYLFQNEQKLVHHMDSQSPRVSIGIPVYNGANYLSAALDCLLAQTYSDFEIVISDNASTDETPAICQCYAASDARIRYHRIEINRGLIWNFNRVVELAQGEYFTWAAHDDLRSTSYLQQCVEVLERNPEVIVCHTQTACVDSTGQVISPDQQPEFTSCTTLDMSASQNACRTGRLLSRKPNRRLEGVLMYTTMCDEIYGLIRTATLRETRLMRPFFGSDMVLLAELALKGKIQVLPETLFFSRSHAEQATFSQGEPEGKVSTPSPTKTSARRFAIPRKIRYPAELFGLVLTSRLPAQERLRCIAILLKFGMQFKKLRGVFLDLQSLVKHRSHSNSSRPSPV